MTLTEEAEFIRLCNAGLETAVIAQQLRIPRGTVQSRAHCLQPRGLIQPRPKGGAYSRQQALAQSEVKHLPSTMDPETWELRRLKHSVQWTIYVPQAMKEALQRRAAALGQNPSLLVQTAPARWLVEEV